MGFSFLSFLSSRVDGVRLWLTGWSGEHSFSVIRVFLKIHVIFFIDLRKEGQEKHGFVVPLTHAFIGRFLCVP